MKAINPKGYELFMKGVTGFLLAPIAFFLIIAALLLMMILSPIYGYYVCVRGNVWFWDYFLVAVKEL